MYAVAQSEVSFTSGGRDIQLDCYLPVAMDVRFPTVVGLYGFGGSHQGMAEPANLLAAQGFAVYVLHYFDRTGNVEPNKGALVRNFPVWMKTLWDAVSYIEQQPQIDAKHIGLVGFSLGAYIALCNAAIDPRIQVVVEFFGGLPKEMKLFMRRFCPVLILHGEDDQTVPVEEAFHLQRLLEQNDIPYEMKLYPGAGHGFVGDVQQDASLRALNFLKKHLAA